MKERTISPIEKDNSVLNSVNYMAQKAILDPNMTDEYKDEILDVAIDTIQKVAERKIAYHAKHGVGRRTRRPK